MSHNIKYKKILGDDGSLLGYEIYMPYVQKPGGKDPDYVKFTLTNDGLISHGLKYDDKHPDELSISSSGGTAPVEDRRNVQINTVIDGVVQPFDMPCALGDNPDFESNMHIIAELGARAEGGHLGFVTMPTTAPFEELSADAETPKPVSLTEEDTKIFNQIQTFPNKPLIWQKKAEAEGEKDINYIFIPIETTKELTFLRVMQKDGKAYINMNGEDGKPTTYELVDAQMSGDTVTISYMREGKVYEKALPTEAVADPTRNGLLVDTLQKVIRNEEITFGEDQRIKEENGCPRVRNFPQKGAVEKSSSLYPKGQILTLEQGGIKYHHIPYATVEGGNLNKDNYLLLMEKDGQHYMNLPGLDPTDPTKKTTCLVEGATYNADGKLEITAVYGGERHKVELPVEKSVTGIVPGTTPPTTATVDNTHIDAAIGQINHTSTMTTTTVDDSHCPRPVNPAPTKDEIVSRAGEAVFGDTLKKVNNKGVDALDTSFTWKGKTFQGKAMPVELKYPDMPKGSKQKISVFDDDKVLLAVTQEGKPPISVFTQDSETSPIYWHVSKDYLDQFKRENPGVDFGSSMTERDGYYVFEVDKVKLSPNMDLEELQIKGASPDLAFMFSSRGFQVKDKDAHVGQMRSGSTPLDISISSSFIERSIQNTQTAKTASGAEPANGLIMGLPMYEKEGTKFVVDKRMANLLVLENRNHRRQMMADGKAGPSDIVEIQLPPKPPASPTGPLLASLPVKQPDGTYQYLDAMSVDGRMYVYTHTTNEQGKSATEPEFALITEMGLQEITTGKATGDISGTTPDDPKIRMGLRTKNNNVKTITLPVDHGADQGTIAWLHSHGTAATTALEESARRASATTRTRTIGGKTYTIYDPRADVSGTIKDEQILGFSRVGDEKGPEPLPPVPTLTDPTYRDIETHDEDIKDPEYVEGRVPLVKRQVSKEEKPLWNGLKNQKLWVGLFALMVTLSTLLPPLAIVAGIIGTILVLNEIQPLKDLKRQIRDYSERRHLSKKGKSLERQIVKNKDYLAMISQQKKNNLKKIEEIRNNKKLSTAKKQARIRALEEENRRLDENMEVIRAETRQKRIELERAEDPLYQKCMKQKKWAQNELQTARENKAKLSADTERRRNENTEITGDLPTLEGIDPTDLSRVPPELKNNPRYKEAFNQQQKYNDMVKEMSDRDPAIPGILEKRQRGEELSAEENEKIAPLISKFGDKLPLTGFIETLRSIISGNEETIDRNDAELASWDTYEHDLEEYADRIETVEAQLDHQHEESVRRYEEINEDVIAQGLEDFIYEDNYDELTEEQKREREERLRERRTHQDSVLGSKPSRSSDDGRTV